MKLKKIVLIILLGITHYSNLLSDSRNPQKVIKNKYVIGSWNGGFGSCFMAVLNHLSYCNEKKIAPVVYWNDVSKYYMPEGFNGKTNVWEYYFKPTSGFLYNKATDTLHEDYTSKGPDYFHYQDISDVTRKKAFQLITTYITFNNIVSDKINSFYKKNMTKKHTIGIHIRGTDKFSEEKLVTPEAIVEEALKYAYQDSQFLVASDEKQLFDRVRKLLPSRKIISYDCYRSEDGAPLHIRSKPSFGQLGEDIAVEIALLAQCNLLVHTASNVSSVALYLNPDLTSILVR